MPQLLSLCSRAQEPQLLKPSCPRVRALYQEKPPQWEASAPQLEKPRDSDEDLMQPKIDIKKKKTTTINIPLNGFKVCISRSSCVASLVHFKKTTDTNQGPTSASGHSGVLASLRLHKPLKESLQPGFWTTQLDAFCLTNSLVPLLKMAFLLTLLHFPSAQFSCTVVSYSLQLHGLQHASLPCPSPTPRGYSNSYPLSLWCHPTISSSVIPFSSCLQSFPASRSLFQWISSFHQMTKVLELQLQRQSFRWIFKTDFL